MCVYVCVHVCVRACVLGEEQYCTFLSRFNTVMGGANHQAGFSPWRAIGQFNATTTGKRRRAVTPLVLKKTTAASSEQHRSWSEISQASVSVQLECPQTTSSPMAARQKTVAKTGFFFALKGVGSAPEVEQVEL